VRKDKYHEYRGDQIVKRKRPKRNIIDDTRKVYRVTFEGWRCIRVHESIIVLAADVAGCIRKARRHEEYRNWEITGLELISQSFL